VTRARPDEPLAVWCEIAIVDVCAGRASQRHHRRRRSQGGSDDRANTLDCCDACHDWAHAHPTIAYLSGWLVHGWEDPADVPVRRGVLP
jgi:hypothetical protein